MFVTKNLYCVCSFFISKGHFIFILHSICLVFVCLRNGSYVIHNCSPPKKMHINPHECLCENLFLCQVPEPLIGMQWFTVDASEQVDPLKLGKI